MDDLFGRNNHVTSNVKWHIHTVWKVLPLSLLITWQCDFCREIIIFAISFPRLILLRTPEHLIYTQYKQGLMPFSVLLQDQNKILLTFFHQSSFGGERSETSHRICLVSIQGINTLPQTATSTPLNKKPHFSWAGKLLIIFLWSFFALTMAESRETERRNCWYFMFVFVGVWLVT